MERLGTRGRAAGWVLLAPFLFGVVVLLAVPALTTFGWAFTDHTGFGAPSWVGVDNLRAAVRDPFFLASLRASLVFAAFAVPLRLLVAVTFGIALARPSRHARWQRVLAYLPSVLPEITLSLAFLWLFNPLYGPVNGVLGLLGLPEPVWLAQPGTARAVIVVMMLFPMGEAFLVVLTARREVPAVLYEQAHLDGAAPWQVLRHVTLPVMAPLLVLLAIRDVVLSLQVNFVPTYLLTDGAPDNSTLFLPVYVFDQAFEFLGFGYGAAITLVLLAVTTSAVALLAWLGRTWLRGLRT